jgi:uncharacterized protein (TIGR02147 family)
MNIFGSIDYKQVLRGIIDEHRLEYGYKTRLAAAAGCQKSFLSQVVNSHVHFTVDHAAALASFWHLNPAESEYFVDLVQLARAGNESLRRLLKRKLERQKREQEDLGRKLRQPDLESRDASSLYYSSWHFAAIHILLTIPEYRVVAAIARRLNLSEELVSHSLEGLKDCGLAKRAGKQWLPARTSIHLSKESAFYPTNLSNWRGRAVMQSLSRHHENIHYSGVHSLSLADFEKLRQLTFAFIESSRKVIDPSREEELYCLNCDLFKV